VKRENDSVRIMHSNPLKYLRIFFDIYLKMTLL